MQNWVYNNLVCEASNETLDNLKEFFDVDVEQAVYNPDTQTYTLTIVNNGLTFTSMRNPFESPYSVSKEDYYATDTKNNWFYWNNDNWDTKWDACNVELEVEDKELNYRFETAWSNPSPKMFLEMSEKFPEILFYMTYEEEQGWGGEYTFQNGKMTYSESYDIPESHKDYVDRGRSCNCEVWGDDEDFKFDDCPKVLTTA
jgi:hypothetical protein